MALNIHGWHGPVAMEREQSMRKGTKKGRFPEGSGPKRMDMAERGNRCI